MRHPINITVINNANGISLSNDGIFAVFIKGIAVGSTLTLNAAYLLTQLSDLTALGVDANYDANNGLAVYQQISEYYAQAGSGALIWLIVVPQSTAYATYVASSTFASLIKFTAQANYLNRAKMIGLCYDVPTATQVATDFPADVLATITALQTIQQTLFNQGFQFSGIIDGNNMSAAVTPTTIGTMATQGAPSVSLCITGTKPNGVSGVGLALGRFARISIGHGFGAVEDGPVNTNTAYLTNAATIPATGVLVVGKLYVVTGGSITYNSILYTVGQSFVAVIGQTTFTTTAGGYVVTNATPIQSLDAYINFDGLSGLGSKQYMFLRTWANRSGFFWNDGATCQASTFQLSTQEYNRVANALSADALNFFIEEMGKNLPIDKKTGAIDQGYLNAKQAEFYSEYIQPLSVDSGSGDLTDGKLILSGPNFNSTKTMLFSLQILPTAILGEVDGTIQFTATL